MQTTYDVDNLGPTTSFVKGWLQAVTDIGPYVNGNLRTKPRERWDFDAELLPGRLQLVPVYIRKWNHPHSARSKFLRTWLGEAFRPEILANPKLLTGHAARLEIRTSVDSDGIMNHRIVAAHPVPK